MYLERGIVCTYILQDDLSTRKTTRTPLLYNPPIRMTPQGTRFRALLHGILPVHGPTLRYSYVYYPMHLHSRHNHRNHCTAVSRACPPSHQVSDASSVIGICSFAGHSF